MWRSAARDDVPQFLESLDLPGIAKYMKSDSCKNVFVMAGAGISTSAGIPDFRSPDTGLYANLARLKLPYPEAVFDISFFKRNPRPFYVLAHELAPGKFRPTPTHSFIRLLAEKGLLHTCFTQNIDTLERAAGVPVNKIIEAHGSFADQHCIKCGTQYSHDKIKVKIEEQEIPICEKKGCNGYVKPDIVFFGESLPDEFSSGVRHLRDADLLIVMGTSLTVHPFASLTELVPDESARLLLNLDHVGGWGSRPNDVACLMSCDKAVRELCRLLGWEKELEALWAETEPPSTPAAKIVIKDGDESKDEKKNEEEVETGPIIASRNKEVMEDLLGDVVDKLTKDIGEVRLEDKKSIEPAGQLGNPVVEGKTVGTSQSFTDDYSRDNPTEKKAQEEGLREGVSTRVAEPTHHETADKKSNTSAVPETGKL